MIDLVNIWRTQVKSMGWKFSYGNEANINLLGDEDAFEADKLYFLLDTIKRDPEFSEFGGTGEVEFSGNFMLVIKSDLDNIYDNQKEVDYTEGRYEKNIRPIIETDLVLFQDYVNCSDYEITSWSILDGINLLDINLDGVIVTFTVKKL